MSTKRIAFIGTRDLTRISAEALTVFKNLAQTSARKDWTLCTGAAQGADQFAAMHALEAGGSVELYLPWDRYEEAWVRQILVDYQGRVYARTYLPDVDEDWTQSVYQYHPNAQSLTQGAFKLHARNYGTIEGCKSVVALPKMTERNPENGGTGQGIRIARGLGIKLYNLAEVGTLAALKQGYSSGETPPAAVIHDQMPGYGWMSNFYPAPIQMFEQVFPTALPGWRISPRHPSSYGR